MRTVVTVVTRSGIHWPERCRYYSEKFNWFCNIALKILDLFYDLLELLVIGVELFDEFILIIRFCSTRIWSYVNYLYTHKLMYVCLCSLVLFTLWFPFVILTGYWRSSFNVWSEKSLCTYIRCCLGRLEWRQRFIFVAIRLHVIEYATMSSPVLLSQKWTVMWWWYQWLNYCLIVHILCCCTYAVNCLYICCKLLQNKIFKICIFITYTC